MKKKILYFCLAYLPLQIIQASDDGTRSIKRELQADTDELRGIELATALSVLVEMQEEWDNDPTIIAADKQLQKDVEAAQFARGESEREEKQRSNALFKLVGTLWGKLKK